MWDGRSWTEGEEGATIVHTHELTLTESESGTDVRLHITITDIGPKAKMAAFGMKMGYKSQLEKLEALLAEAA